MSRDAYSRKKGTHSACKKIFLLLNMQNGTALSENAMTQLENGTVRSTKYRIFFKILQADHLGTQHIVDCSLRSGAKIPNV